LGLAAGFTRTSKAASPLSSPPEALPPARDKKRGHEEGKKKKKKKKRGGGKGCRSTMAELVEKACREKKDLLLLIGHQGPRKGRKGKKKGWHDGRHVDAICNFFFLSSAHFASGKAVKRERKRGKKEKGGGGFFFFFRLLTPSSPPPRLRSEEGKGKEKKT